MNPQSIYISGLGVISPLGLDTDSFWSALVSGKTAIAPLRKIPTEGLRNTLGGEIHGFDWSHFGEDGDCDEASGFAFAAALKAAHHAGLNEVEMASAGLCFATNFGGAVSWEACCDLAREGESDPETYAQFLPHHALSYTASRWKNNGPHLTLSNACSSGTHALGIAFDWLRLGRCEIAVAGGFDGLGVSTLAGLSILRTISPDEIRPFDKRRNGTIFGEGAGMVILETEASLQRRGAKPLARILGYGVSNNAHHLTAPDKGGAGLALAMGKALQNAQIAPHKIGYVNAHGTGTQLNDLAETQAIRGVFGAHADDLAVSSIKAATSHLMGAAGVIEAIACVQALQTGVLPATLGFEIPGEGCDLDYIPQTAREHNVQIALSNSSGIGGNNTSILLAKV